MYDYNVQTIVTKKLSWPLFLKKKKGGGGGVWLEFCKGFFF